jgi:PTH1 family peptidyl-tRNA hydrolase
MEFNSNIKLLVGLGNPGQKYANTYHNAGFLALDYLVKQTKLNNWRVLKSKNFACQEINNLKLVKPLAFMNESGKAVSQALKFFRLSPEEMLVVHDDSDLNLGDFKLSFDRGSAGHHGVESIIRTLKTKSFWRFRVGIRRKSEMRNEKLEIRRAGLPTVVRLRRTRAKDFVLKKITLADKKILYGVFGAIVKLIEKESP